MSRYSDFAYCYDALMGDVDYSARTEYLLELFRKFGEAPTLMLDVACGTGKFSTEFAKRGIEVIGTDPSEDMLAVARENTAEAGLDILYLCQAAEELDLYGTVDGAICCMDSINHITDKAVLGEAFKKVSLFLEPQKLFIFDVNTVYKHRNILGNNTYVLDEDGIYCVWQNELNSDRNETLITLDFFTEEDGCYYRSGEEFFERGYTFDELEELLTAAGLKTEAIYSDMTQKPPEETCQRAIFVCRKLN